MNRKRYLTVTLKAFIFLLAWPLLSFPSLADKSLTETAFADKSRENPSIKAGVPFFYYQDLQAAADWYENKLGLKRIANKDWVIIFALNSASQIGLVNATGGSLIPTENKGVVLSIETDELEAWWNILKDVEGINMIHGIEEGAKGMIQEFRMYDPGGYIVEFFRWQISPEERMKPDPK